MSVEETFSEIERRLREIQTNTSYRPSMDVKYGEIVTPTDWFGEGEWIWIKLNSKATANGEYFYGWQQMLRLVNATGSYTWINGEKFGSVNEFPAIALNNDNLSTTDGRRYPARWNPDTYQWIFFLRDRETLGVLNYRFTGTAASSLTAPVYGFSKRWFRTNAMTGNGTCPSGDFVQSQTATYNNITFYYEYSNGTRSNLATFQNNGTANSPIDVWFSANVTFPGRIGVDCVYYDGSVFGSHTNANGCVNGYAHQVAADTNANMAVSASGNNITLAIPFTPTIIYPADDLAWPSEVTVNFNVSYGQANAGWPAAVQTAFNNWSANIASQLQKLTVGVNQPIKSCTGYTVTHGRITGTPTHEFDVTSGTCGTNKIRIWLESRTENAAAQPYYFAGSKRVNSSGVNTELKYSFAHNGGGTVKIGSALNTGTLPTNVIGADMAKLDECTLIKTWSPNSSGNLSMHQINVGFGYDDAGTCTVYQQTFSLMGNITRS
jgi:hypothetical protein